MGELCVTLSADRDERSKITRQAAKVIAADDWRTDRRWAHCAQARLTDVARSEQELQKLDGVVAVRRIVQNGSSPCHACRRDRHFRCRTWHAQSWGDDHGLFVSVVLGRIRQVDII